VSIDLRASLPVPAHCLTRSRMPESLAPAPHVYDPASLAGGAVALLLLAPPASRCSASRAVRVATAAALRNE
jgi:hypothetical protein